MLLQLERDHRGAHAENEPKEQKDDQPASQAA
jgi:hypothetical protein